MKVLVTGGAGYIGSVTVKSLINGGHQVTVLDSLEKGHRQAVAPEAKFIQANLHQTDKVSSLLSETSFDAVIHFAGYIESGESMKSPLKFFENNFSVGINLLNCLNQSGPKKIVFSSTAGVYGEGHPPFTEGSPINATSNYSLSKYFFEQALAAAVKANGFQAIVLRYFNAAGATLDGALGEAHEPETHLIPLVIKTALGLRSHFELYGTDYTTPDGTACRDYIHVEDLAAAHILCLNKFNSSTNADGAFFEIYNVGNGQSYSNRQIIDLVKKISGKDLAVTEKPRRAGDWDRSFADASKIQKNLGWKARYGLEEIIESAYVWHQQHPYGFSSQ